jgi:hypothetical protein
MLQNDMKKGQLGVLKNGWKFRIEDNKKGNIRMATVYGIFTEMGSIYTRDIATVEVDGVSERLEQTPAQKKKADKTALLLKAFYGG